MYKRQLLRCRFTYADWARAEPLLRKEAGVGVGEPEYGGDVAVLLDAPPEAVPALKSLLMEKTAGRVAAEAAGERLSAVRRDED